MDIENTKKWYKRRKRNYNLFEHQNLLIIMIIAIIKIIIIIITTFDMFKLPSCTTAICNLRFVNVKRKRNVT